MSASSIPRTNPVASSQTTAPVTKFRCLFTHDLRRKAKRWQDGFLRFHSFNRRIMVYDVTGIFVGDLHWRESGALQDGDELELERGVLVQVGECVERSETDLTELLEKKTRQSTTGSSPARPFSPMSRSSAPSTAGESYTPHPRLKSLNELLGIKKNAIGRAGLPTKSPYEERHRVTSNTPPPAASERAPKRQKLNSPAAITHEVQSRDGNPEPVFHKPSIPITSSSRISTVSQAERRSHRLPPSSPPRRTAPTPTSQRGTPHDASKIRISTLSTSIPDSSSSETTFNTLRIAVEKPRKKLMYRDLLPQKNIAQKPSNLRQDSSTVTKTKAREISPSKPDSPPGLRSRRPSSSSPKKKHPRLNVLTPGDPNTSLSFVPSSSMLQALEESLPPPSSQKTKSINDFFQRSRQKSPARAHARVKANDDTVQQPEPQIDSPAAPSPLSPPPKKQAVQQRTLTRSRSEIAPVAQNTLLDDHDHHHHPMITPAIPPIPEHQAPTNLPLQTPTTTTVVSNATATKPPPPKPLQKSLSDTSTLRVKTSSGTNMQQMVFATSRDSFISAAAAAATSSPIDADEEEQGPWTTEALDLFDWWPAGRPKPKPKPKPRENEEGEGVVGMV
ncbi:hypothetical protein AJ80_08367 [Polytolypa hystricis UAMH7299]|uniref:5'-3' DNA helicase ZGRF1-like N-terminal domain-containing protein n=1 Tax=Polytolypa hystricis (strain UAMH7299) TaxID=1447883 RepID=A0A2B7X8P1_POLH7|nr:hypothetical protein AJ80_08367 [Polytolypa hystricis UAMH7299]